MGLAEGIVPLIGFNYAAKNKKRLKEAIKYTTILIIFVAIIISWLIFIFSADIIKVFSNNAEVIKYGSYIIKVALVSTFTSGITMLISGIFQALGKGAQSFIMGIIQGFLYIPFIICGNIFYGFHGLVWALPIAEICALIIALLLLITLRGEFSNGKDTVLVQE